ncbi:MAG: hypothetical protein QXT74_03195 [Candidatus Nezhaarchaeales archaeon]
MNSAMVNRALITLALAMLIGTFRVYAGPLALPLLGLAIFLGAVGAVLMWIGLTHKSKEELEDLHEKVKSFETSSGLFEILLIITIALSLLLAVGILLAAL